MNFIDFTNFIDLFRQGQEQPHHPVNKTGHHDGCRNRKNPSSHDIRGRSPPNSRRESILHTRKLSYRI